MIIEKEHKRNKFVLRGNKYVMNHDVPNELNVKEKYKK
jgi:hypothetical protein